MHTGTNTHLHTKCVNMHTAGHKTQHRQHSTCATMNSTKGLILLSSSGCLGWKPLTGMYAQVWVPAGVELRHSVYPCGGSWVLSSPVMFCIDTHVQMGLCRLHGVSGWPRPPGPPAEQAQTFWSLQHLAQTYDCPNTCLPGQLPSLLAVQPYIG